MLGAICGDVIGSRHEFYPHKSTEFELLTPQCRWTDDTVCTVAVAEALLSNGDVGGSLAAWVDRHMDSGFAQRFLQWATSEPPRAPYGSWGNGSAMRCSPAAWLSGSVVEAASLGAYTAAPTHDHHHGLRGAKATAVAVRMALEGWGREEIRAVLSDRYGYDLSRSPDAIRPSYSFKVGSHNSVPEALCCALSASSYEEAVRLAVSLGGDADTQAAIAGSVAEPMFGIPPDIANGVIATLTPRMRDVHTRFRLEVEGCRWERTDPGRLSRDLPPPRSKAAQNYDDQGGLEMAKMEMLERIAREPDGLLTRTWRRISRLLG